MANQKPTTALSRICALCNEDKPKTAFTINQLKQGVKKNKCTTCVESSRAPKRRKKIRVLTTDDNLLKVELPLAISVNEVEYKVQFGPGFDQTLAKRFMRVQDGINTGAYLFLATDDDSTMLIITDVKEHIKERFLVGDDIIIEAPENGDSITPKTHQLELQQGQNMVTIDGDDFYPDWQAEPVEASLNSETSYIALESDSHRGVFMMNDGDKLIRVKQCTSFSEFMIMATAYNEPGKLHEISPFQSYTDWLLEKGPPRTSFRPSFVWVSDKRFTLNDNERIHVIQIDDKVYNVEFNAKIDFSQTKQIYRGINEVTDKFSYYILLSTNSTTLYTNTKIPTALTKLVASTKFFEFLTVASQKEFMCDNDLNDAECNVLSDIELYGNGIVYVQLRDLPEQINIEGKAYKVIWNDLTFDFVNMHTIFLGRDKIVSDTNELYFVLPRGSENIIYHCFGLCFPSALIDLLNDCEIAKHEFTPGGSAAILKKNNITHFSMHALHVKMYQTEKEIEDTTYKLIWNSRGKKARANARATVSKVIVMIVDESEDGESPDSAHGFFAVYKNRKKQLFFVKLGSSIASKAIQACPELVDVNDVAAIDVDCLDLTERLVDPNTIPLPTSNLYQNTKFLVYHNGYTLHCPSQTLLQTFPDGSNACLWAGMYAAISVIGWVPSRPIPTGENWWSLGFLSDELNKPIAGRTYKFVKQQKFKESLLQEKRFLSTLFDMRFGIFLLIGTTGCGRHCFMFNGWKRFVYLCDDNGTCVSVRDSDVKTESTALEFTSTVLGLSTEIRRVYLLMRE